MRRIARDEMHSFSPGQRLWYTMEGAERIPAEYREDCKVTPGKAWINVKVGDDWELRLAWQHRLTERSEK